MTLCYWVNTARVTMFSSLLLCARDCLGVSSLCFFKKTTLTLLVSGYFEDWILENTTKGKRGERRKQQTGTMAATVLSRAVRPRRVWIHQSWGQNSVQEQFFTLICQCPKGFWISLSSLYSSTKREQTKQKSPLSRHSLPNRLLRKWHCLHYPFLGLLLHLRKHSF